MTGSIYPNSFKIEPSNPRGFDRGVHVDLGWSLPPRKLGPAIRYHLKHSIFLLLFLTFNLHAQSLTQSLDQLIEHSLPQAEVAVQVQDAQSGRVIYQRNTHKMLSPASNVKLFTAVAALSQLGPHYRYQTTLSQQGQDIFLTFNGDPSLTTAQLKQLLATLKKQKSIRNIVLDSTHFQAPDYPNGMSFDDVGWYYAAPSTAIMLNGNAEAYEVLAVKNQPIQFKAKSPDRALTLINELRTVTPEQEKLHCGLHIEVKPHNTLRLYGCVAAHEGPSIMQFAIPDPIGFATQIIRSQIHITGQIMTGKTPSHAQPLAQVQSAELIKLVQHMLEESDNLYADSFTKQLGVVKTGVGTYKQGVFAIRSILADHTPLNMQSIDLADGLGTRYNYTTVAQLSALLKVLYHNQTLYPLFLNTLPRMAETGTLKDRMKKTPLQGRVFAKTGSMHDISSLSGYMKLPNGKMLIFSMISNGVIGGIGKAKALENQILLTLYQNSTL